MFFKKLRKFISDVEECFEGGRYEDLIKMELMTREVEKVIRDFFKLGSETNKEFIKFVKNNLKENFGFDFVQGIFTDILVDYEALRVFLKGSVESLKVLQSISEPQVIESDCLEKTKELCTLYPEFMNRPLHNGFNLLETCMVSGRKKIFDYLISVGVDVNVAGKSGETSLHLASAGFGGKDCYKKLVERGAVELEDDSGNFPHQYEKESQPRDYMSFEYLLNEPDRTPRWIVCREKLSRILTIKIASQGEEKIRDPESSSYHRIHMGEFWIILHGDFPRKEIRTLNLPPQDMKIEWEWFSNRREWKKFGANISKKITKKFLGGSGETFLEDTYFKDEAMDKCIDLEALRWSDPDNISVGNFIRWVPVGLQLNEFDVDEENVVDTGFVDGEESLDVLISGRIIGNIEEEIEEVEGEDDEEMMEGNREAVNPSQGPSPINPLSDREVLEELEMVEDDEINESVRKVGRYPISCEPQSFEETIVFDIAFRKSEILSRLGGEGASIEFAKREGGVIMIVEGVATQLERARSIIRSLSSLFRCLRNLVSQLDEHPILVCRTLLEKHVTNYILTNGVLKDRFFGMWNSFCHRFQETLRENVLEKMFRSFSGEIGKKIIESSCVTDLIEEKKDWLGLVYRLIQNDMELIRTKFEVEFCKSARNVLKELLLRIMEEIMQEKGIKKEERSVENVKKYIEKVLDVFVEKSMKTLITEILLKSSTTTRNNNNNARLGRDLRNAFRNIVDVLFKTQLFLLAFRTNRTVFRDFPKILAEFENKRVLSVQTSTGSGKSTLLPLLLYATDFEYKFKKICITQPRRLPCSQLAKFLEDTFGDKLAGYAMSGKRKNLGNPIHYITDGLLRKVLCVSPNRFSYDIVILDEIHERGINTDLSVGLLIDRVTSERKYENFRNLKIVLCSATLDSEVVEKPFTQNGMKPAQFVQKRSEKTPFPIIVKNRFPHHPLTIVKELSMIKKRGEQILCFFASSREVREACEIFNRKHEIKAYPLYGQQNPENQLRYLEEGTIFFSTNISETSLTFPCLKFVVDTGKINVACVDSKTGISSLEESKAPQSTLDQRKGRAGRTMAGEYHHTYEIKQRTSLLEEEEEGEGEDDDGKDFRRRFPTPPILLNDLFDIDFELRRSPDFPRGILDISLKLPTYPGSERIKEAQKTLSTLGVVDENTGLLSEVGRVIMMFPDMYGVRHAICAYFGFQNDCGGDVIRICCMLMSLPSNPSRFLNGITTQRYKSPNGDFQTLLNVFNVAWSVYSRTGNVDKVGLIYGRRILFRACQRYERILLGFQRFSPNNRTGLFYRTACRQVSGDWNKILPCLLEAFRDNIFYCSKEMLCYHNEYERLSPPNPKREIKNNNNSVRSIVQGSGLKEPKCFFAHTIFRTSYMYEICSVSILGLIDDENMKLLVHPIEMSFECDREEVEIAKKMFLQETQKFKNRTTRMKMKVQKLGKSTSSDNLEILTILGCGKDVIKFRTKLMKACIVKKKFRLENIALEKCRDKNRSERVKLNVRTLMSESKNVFGPMRWRWMNEGQVEMKIYQSSSDFKVTGRLLYVKRIEDEIKALGGWIGSCDLMCNLQEILSLNPTRLVMKGGVKGMLDRIAKVTDPDRSEVDIFDNLHGENATRETRMEVVAWLLVTQFEARLEGGFVRDWIVGYGKTSKPRNIRNWLTAKDGKAWTPKKSKEIPILHEQIIPQDLDVQLSFEKVFDIKFFKKEIHRLGMGKVYHYRDNGFRYVFIFDVERREPFMVDMIEPHISITHSRIDFDVNNLCVRKGYTKELALRIDTTKSNEEKIKEISKESIVKRIKKQEMIVMSAQDARFAGLLNKRKEKMEKRGWKIIDSVNFLPAYEDIPTITELHRKDELYQHYQQKFNTVGKILKIFMIENRRLSRIYEGFKKLVRSENGENENEKTLYHGTKQSGVEGIQISGLDNRYFNSSGAFGPGAYFANDPRKSNAYTGGGGVKTIFVMKVILGKQQVIRKFNVGTHRKMSCCEKGFHSLHVLKGAFHSSSLEEFIVYRYGCSLPLYKIIYQ